MCGGVSLERRGTSRSGSCGAEPSAQACADGHHSRRTATSTPQPCRPSTRPDSPCNGSCRATRTSPCPSCRQRPDQPASGKIGRRRQPRHASNQPPQDLSSQPASPCPGTGGQCSTAQPQPDATQPDPQAHPPTDQQPKRYPDE